MQKLVHIEKRKKGNVSIVSDVEYFSHNDRLKLIKKERGVNWVFGDGIFESFLY